MIGELGHFALILAFVVATIQGVVPLLGAWRRIPAWTAMAVSAARAQFLLIGLSYLCLTHLFIVSTSALPTSRRTPTPRCRSSTKSPRYGAPTKARCCCGPPSSRGGVSR